LKPRLSEQEREDLKRTAESLIASKRIVSVCAYGSKVAGYSRKDSDYDLIVIVKKFQEGVRYKYVTDPIGVSALIVEESLLMEDAANAALGEFVVGRFLNVYQPLSNEQVPRRAEIDYKRRIIAEALFELSSDYGDFSRNLIIPFDYFLFDKLKKRAMVYPPALYSYSRTYSGMMGGENKEFSLSGFREAASSLASKNLIRFRGDSITINPEKLKGDAFTKFLSLFSMTARGVTQYAIHGYAGRVGLGVFKKEAFSKLRRMREKENVPIDLERPRRLLKLEEGVIFDQAASMNEEVAALYGFGKNYTVIERSAGEVYTTARVLTFTGAERSASFVVKRYSDIRSLKWALLSIWAFTARKFSMAPLSRLHREYFASLSLRRRGVKSPKIVGIAPDERVLIREFVEGPLLSDVIHRLLAGSSSGLISVENFGRALAAVHKAGFALGDSKASNVVIANGEVYLTDLEQALEGGDMAWDIAEFLYYTAKLSSKGGGMEKLARTFLDAYKKENGKDAISKARSVRYLAPFQPFVTPNMTKLIRDLMEEYAA
jgi:tRNA A-37 threonylcarbamoyl transferase component Bud32/predicted nucleotidyltransferase